MSDITANLVIGMPAQLFTLARSFKANANGKIYIGQPDTDPTNPANQIQVYVENEDGSHVPVPQPIIINSGGYPVLGGQIKKFVTVQNYSMAIYDAYNAQQFYFKDVAKYDPDQLRSDMSSDEYQFVGGSENLTSAPSKLVYGPGEVTLGSITFNKLTLGFDLPNSSAYLNPESYYDVIGENPDPGDKLNMVLSIGAKKQSGGSWNRCTFFGTQGPRQTLGMDRCDAFGNGALMYMRYGERTTAIGTISCQWLGTDNPERDGHNYWQGDGPNPGQPGWDYSGFETANPGIGAKIAAFHDFAQAPSDCGRVVGVGRNTFNGTVQAKNSTAVGYRAAASAYAVEGLTAFGTDAFRNAIFVNASEAMGYLAATNWQEGERNLIAGNQAAVKVVRGNSSIHLGAFAGSNFTDSNFNIFLGVGAGNNISATTLTPSYCLAIGHDISGIAGSLIAGKMDTRRLGVNTLPEKIMGTLHVRTSDYGPVTPAHGNADDLLVENDTNTGITVRSGATGFGSLFFANPSSQNRASIVYNHANDTMTLRTASADRFSLDSAAFFPATDNTLSIGKASNRASVIYASTGSINTSDSRAKTDIEELNAVERVVAIKLKGLIRRYKFLDAIADKGGEARYHVGIIAQEVKAAFESEGLIAEDYGILCFDEWDDQYETIAAETVSHPAEYSTLVDGNGNPLVLREAWEEVVKPEETVKTVVAGNRYGIRYEELLCFIIAAI